MAMALQLNPWRRTLQLTACLGLLCGCTDSKSGDTTSPDSGAAPPLEACRMSPSVGSGDRFDSARERFTITLADLEPPTPSIGDNSWQIAVRDANAEPASDASLSFSLWMPEHAHGSLKTVLIEPLGEGAYLAAPLSFHMPGVWEVTITLESPNASDRLVFTTCVVP